MTEKNCVCQGVILTRLGTVQLTCPKSHVPGMHCKAVFKSISPFMEDSAACIAATSLIPFSSPSFVQIGTALINPFGFAPGLKELRQMGSSEKAA